MIVLSVGDTWSTREIIAGPELRRRQGQIRQTRQSYFLVRCSACKTERWLTASSLKPRSLCRCQVPRPGRPRNGCKVCGEIGHLAKTCAKRKPAPIESKPVPASPPLGANPIRFLHPMSAADAADVQRLNCARRGECLSYVYEMGWASWDCRGCSVTETLTLEEHRRDMDGMAKMIAAATDEE